MSLLEIIPGQREPRTVHATAAPRQRAPRPAILFPGITRAAKRLKVTRIHLYLVLSGQRTSHRLLKRYQALHTQNAA